MTLFERRPRNGKWKLKSWPKLREWIRNLLAAAYTHGQSNKWVYLAGVVEDCHEHFGTLESALRDKLLPAICGHQASDIKRDLFSLLCRFGWLGLYRPPAVAAEIYQAATNVTKPLVDLTLRTADDANPPSFSSALDAQQQAARLYNNPGWHLWRPISANEATQTRSIAVRCSSATSKTGNRFGWSFFFAVWRRWARSQLHMNSVVLVESQLRFGSNRTAPKIWQEGQHDLHRPPHPIDWREHTIGAVHDRNLPTRSLQVPESYENFLWHRVKVRSIVTGLRHDGWWARWRSQSSSCQHHVITWRGLIPADHEYLDSVAWPCHDCEVAPVWHHDVTNARTCQFFRRLYDRLPFEFRPRTFTIGFYGKNSIISELMILECSFPLSLFVIKIASWPTRIH